MAFRGGTYRQGRSWSYGDRNASCDVFCMRLLLFSISTAVLAYCLYQEYFYRVHTAGLGELQPMTVLQMPQNIGTFLNALGKAQAWPAVKFSVDGDYRNLTELIAEDSTTIMNGKLGPLLHFNTTDYIATVSDVDFSLSFGPKTLQLQRVTEYCQWHETSHDTCKSCSREVRRSDGRRVQEKYDCDCVRHFHYIKSWSSHRVNSFFFDQPGAHHNPQRDPYPSKLAISRDLELRSRSGEEGLHIFPELVAQAKAPTHTVRWSPRQIDFFSDFQQSEASALHRFVYAGDGYFFSSHEGSHTEFFLKKFAQWLEGSILDYQLGDLLPSCTAGDIRVHFTAMEPEMISGVGRLIVTDDAEEEAVVAVGLASYHTAAGTHVALLRGGNLSTEELIMKEGSDLKYQLYIARALVVAWFALWWFCRSYGFCQTTAVHTETTSGATQSSSFQKPKTL